MPGTPAPNDATCDGIDDDCDFWRDEDFVIEATSCGVGACASTGLRFCNEGAVLDACTPLPPSPDTTCNRFDDDCDTLIDEGFVSFCAGPELITCGATGLVSTPCNDFDVCTGIETCEEGACAPGTPLEVDDANPCTSDSCDPVGGVQHTPVANGTSCTNSNACDGLETCQSGACTAGTAPLLDDGNPCTADACHPLTGVSHTVLPFGTSCDDGDPCNGVEVCTALGVCLAGPRPLEGACVPPGPTAAIHLDEGRELLRTIEGASIVSYTGSTPPRIFGDRLEWSSDTNPGGAQVIVDLADDLDGTAVVDRISIRSFGLRRFEVAASRGGTNPADFTTILAAEAPNNETSEWEVERTTARYLRVTLLDQWNGTLGRGSFGQFTAYTRTRDGGALNVFESGSAPITAPTNPSQARFATDWDPTTAYVTSSWSPGHTLQIDLPGVTRHVIDRVRMRGHPDWNSLRDFEVWISSTGTDPADFTQVLVGELPNVEQDHWYFFSPVAARYVQLRAISTGGGPNLTIRDFQTFTMVRGGLVAPFESRSTAGGLPLVFWRWDFGDGDVSFEEHPTHEYAAPGEYLVRLEVIDEYGLWAQTELLYAAEAGPIADMSWAPGAPRQGDRIFFTDRSEPTGQPVVAALWDLRQPAIATAPTTASTAAGQTVFFDGFYPQPLEATLTSVDASFLRTTTRRTIAVTDTPPPARCLHRSEPRLGPRVVASEQPAASADRRQRRRLVRHRVRAGLRRRIDCRRPFWLSGCQSAQLGWAAPRRLRWSAAHVG